MILSYAGMAFLFYAMARLYGEVKCLKHRVSRLEFSGIGAGSCYKPHLTLQEQIADELHFLICDDKRD